MSSCTGGQGFGIALVVAFVVFVLFFAAEVVGTKK